jgi:TolA-binding protein
MLQIKPLRCAFGWLCFLILLNSAPGGSFGASPPRSSANERILTRVVSVNAKTTEGETVLTVRGNGIIQEYTCDAFADPLRLVIDLLCASEGFQSMYIPLDSPIVEKARIGRHPDRIRLALDLKGFSLPAFSVEREGESLRIKVSFYTPTGSEKSQEAITADLEKGNETLLETQVEEIPLERVSTAGSAPESDAPKEKKSTLEELLEVKEEDGDADDLVFRRGVDAFRAKQWAGALDCFRSILEKYPQGRYAERASFLLAKSFEGQKENDVAANFVDMRGRYDDFISRFPSSRYGGDALAAIGHLCFKVGHHEEAMGYFGLAFSRDKEAPSAAVALAGKMKIFMMKRQFDDALALARYILEHYPGSAESVDAALDMAKILHELNRFQESLTALSTLVKDDVRNAYLRPEISLYLGYNGFQLGNFPMARDNLFRFYNARPWDEEVPFVLTKIGDTYRDETQFDAAGKVYGWVAERYPDTEGALISRIRLAELQEQGKRSAHEKGLGFIAQPGDKIPSPKEVYEAALRSSKLKDAKNPLIALALLKLAVLYQKDGEYGKSLNMIKELLHRFPGPQLRKETEHVLLKALEGMISERIQAKDYHRAISFYYEEQDLFSRIDSPELHLAMARAFLKIDLPGEAVALFGKAGSLLPEKEKPGDLLYFMALNLHRQKRYDLALDKLNAVTEQGGYLEYVSRAYLLRGRIMAEQKQWENAQEAFAAALNLSSEPCIHLEALTEKAAAQAASGAKDAGLRSAREARALAGACGNPSLAAYEALAAVFSLLGSSDEALAILTEALGKEDGQNDQERLRWKLARSYESLGKKEDSLSVYRDISNRDDPLWRNLAKEKIEEIRFREEIDSFNMKGRRKAQSAL